MKKPPFLVLLILLFGLTPVCLAVNQQVRTLSAYQQVVLLLSIAAFGLVLGQFWLSRRLSHNTAGMPMEGIIRFHKIIGYAAGGFLLLHPLLMIARRLWVQESNPLDNLMLMLRAPALLPAIIAWVLLVLIVLLALPPLRRTMRATSWRILHGLLSVGFVSLATWHAVAIGRHSNLTMSAFWIALTISAVVPLLFSYLPARPKTTPVTTRGALHETAR